MPGLTDSNARTIPVWRRTTTPRERRLASVRARLGSDVHTIEHTVTFADEAAWGHYRRQVSERSHDPAWERRRTEQGHWWHLLDATLLSDPPVPLGFNRAPKPQE
ncbi:hypothetical protein ACQUSR_27925 [Streptomyces sp. P1-3]|uniref:hypothetical protein n=1 Tax=Streptomyces sp. P1-3 TaxID=3421658 RepID=UPI003D36457E